MWGQLRIIQGGHLKSRGDWEKFKYEGARLSGGLLQRVYQSMYIRSIFTEEGI